MLSLLGVSRLLVREAEDMSSAIALFGVVVPLFLLAALFMLCAM